MRAAPALNHRILLAVDARLEEPIDAVDEVVAVELRVKPDDADAEHSFEKLVPAGAYSELLRIGPGDVPEHDDRGAGKPLADEAGHERKVVVLHEHDGVFGIHLRAERLREPLVYRLVVLPVLAAEDGAGVSDVAQRPEAFVGKAVVVALLLFRSEPDAPNKVRFLAGGNAYARVPVGGLAVRGAAAMGDPHARTGAHNRLQGGDQAARRMNDGDPPIPGALVNVRLAVGDDDHLLAV